MSADKEQIINGVTAAGTILLKLIDSWIEKLQKTRAELEIELQTEIAKINIELDSNLSELQSKQDAIDAAIGNVEGRG